MGTPFICGQETGEVLLIDSDCDPNTTPPIWQWTAAKASNIQSGHAAWFRENRDVRYARNGKHLLLCTNFVVGLIDIRSNDVEFYFGVDGNPHAAALLPDGNVVVARVGGTLRVISTDPKASPSPSQPAFSDEPLLNAHGVVWDDARQCVWALGSYVPPPPPAPATEPYGIVHRYTYNGKKLQPKLTRTDEFTFPKKNNGHDLYPTGDGKTLFVTFEGRVWLFDLETHLIDAHPDPTLHMKGKVKAISASGCQIAYTFPPGAGWTTDTVSLYDLKSQVSDQRTLKGAAWYKARWWLPN